MIEGQDIICFSNDWDSDPLSKKHIMQRLAKRNRVLWVNSLGNRNPTVSARDFKRVVKKLWQFTQGLRQVEKNIHVFSPIAIPFHGNGIARRINEEVLSQRLRSICRHLGFRNPITWSFLPTSAEIAGTLGEQLVIYHCVDEFCEFTGTNRAAILEMERWLIRKADLVIVSSKRLYQSKRLYNPNTFLVTHGVDVEHFRKACHPATRVPEDLGRLPRPRIGFYGLIADWVDLELIRHLASTRPDWSFVLIGKVDTDMSALNGLSNVHLLGRKEYAVLPAYSRGFDIAILPFAVNSLTLAANPLKLREYLAAGLPVVATAIPEAEALQGLVRIGRSFSDFLAQIEGLFREGRIGPRLSVSRAMDGESWDGKVEEMSEIVAQARSPETELALAS